MAVPKCSGASLLELLVSLCILGLIAAGLHRLYCTASRSLATLTAASQAEDGARICIEVIQRDLRGAGFSPDGSLRDGILVAAATAIQIARDLNGDGDTQDANERVGYSLDKNGLRLMRRMGNAPPQPMLNDLAEHGLMFTYFDGSGMPLHAAEDGLDPAARQRVRRVDIRLAVEVPAMIPGKAQRLRSEHTATVSLRNDFAKAQ